MSTVLINSYKRFTIDLSNTSTGYPTYTLSNENTASVYCHLSLFLSTSDTSNSITVTIDYYNSLTIDHSDTFILNNANNELDRIIRLYTDKAIISISYSTFTGKLFGIITKNTENIITNNFNNNSSTNIQNNNISTSLYDAFGRLKVSNTFTLFDSFNRYTISGKFSTYMDVSSNISLNSDSSLSLTCGAYSTSMVIRESKNVYTYQPGKSLLILCSFTMNELLSNLIQRVGYFGPSDGIFLEASGTTINFVKRVQGIDTKISQTYWNGSRLIGESPDFITLDLSKSQIFWIDIEWLGVGSVRCGFVINGKYYLCHTFLHANQITGTYMTTACLPIRYEIRNTADVSGGTLKQICSSVQSEGGYEGTSIIRHQGTDNFLITLTYNNVFYPIVSIKLKSTRLDSIVIPAQLSISNTITNSLLEYKVLLNATLTGANFINYDSSSNVMYDVSATSFTGGTIINSGIFNQSNSVILSSSKDFNHQLGRALLTDSTYKSDIITVVIASLTNISNPQVGCLLGWYELT